MLRRRHGAAARSRRGTHPSPLPGSAPPDPRARASGARRLKEVAELLTFSSIIQRSLVVTYWDRCRQLTGGESAPSGFSLMALNDRRLPPAEQRHLHSPAATLNYSAFGRCLLTQERDHSRLPEITRDASSPRSAPAPREAGHAADYPRLPEITRDYPEMRDTRQSAAGGALQRSADSHRSAALCRWRHHARTETPARVFTPLTESS